MPAPARRPERLLRAGLAFRGRDRVEAVRVEAGAPGGRRIRAEAAPAVGRVDVSEASMHEQQARETLLAHGIPPALLDVWHDARSPLRHLAWSQPDFALARDLADLVPGLRDLCPMYEQNGEAVIGVLPQSGRFVRYHYEDAREGDAAIEVLGQGYQQFAARVLLELEEAGMSKLYAELASVLQFERGAELRALLDADPYDDAAVEDFHSRLADRP
jgi:hypothetical protein